MTWHDLESKSKNSVSLAIVQLTSHTRSSTLLKHALSSLQCTVPSTGKVLQDGADKEMGYWGAK
jgi:hypothetical protein